MAKKSSVKARKKAVKKLDKAVKRAVKKGVPEEVVGQTVDGAMGRTVTKEGPVKRNTTRTSGRAKKTPALTARLQDEDLD